MKTHKKFLTVCLLSLLLAGIASGSVFVMRTVRTYDGTCAKLGGFPGFLQETGLLATGNCGQMSSGKCTGNPCTVGGKPGRCLTEEREHESHCVCVPRKISR